MRIASIHIYPVKGLAGIGLESAIIDQTGFRGDRRYMLVDETGRFISQREYPALTRFSVNLEKEGFQIKSDSLNGESISLPLFGAGKEIVEVKIWDDHVSALDTGDENAQFFSDHLGCTCRLVYMNDPFARMRTIVQNTPNTAVSFGDSSPFLIVGTASIGHLNNLLKTKIDTLRFRPNIVVKTTIAHEEDDMKEFSAGEIVFQFVKRCGRCNVITIDPQTGITEAEPLKVLSTYRKVDNSVYFGSYFRSNGIDRVVRVGDDFKYTTQ